MKKYTYIIIITFLLAFYGKVKAQPTAVKNAAKSVFKLTTYKTDGSLLATSNGVFIGNDGEGISNLQPFIGAAKAVVTDSKGKTMAVTRILGINGIYDMARFKVEGKTNPLSSAPVASVSGAQVWLIPFSMSQSSITSATVKNVETFMDKYSYYIFSISAPDGTTACPFVNSQGQVIGLMQPSTTNTDIHATDANFAMSLKTTGLSLNNATMQKIGIPAALPKEKEQALLALMISEQNNDSTKHIATINDFIAQYPDLIDGYTSLAQTYININNFDDAAKVMETAIKNVSKKDEAHYNYGKLIYNKEIYQSDIPYASWSLDKALDETNKAYAINAQSTYLHQRAQIIFSQGQYQKAYDMFISLLNSEIRNPELFYEAARCKQMLQAPAKERIALLDSAINNTDTLRIQEAAQYFLARAEAYNEIDSFRQAVFDYTRYEILSNRNVNANFYYVREQAEVKSKLYKQALIDIATSIIMDPKEPTYYAEKASLELKVNMLDDAIKTANICIKVAPEYSDGYLILGLAQIKKNNKQEGLANLVKAKDLGNVQAQTLIEKYSK